jgi:hypothetical protein
MTGYSTSSSGSSDSLSGSGNDDSGDNNNDLHQLSFREPIHKSRQRLKGMRAYIEELISTTTNTNRESKSDNPSIIKKNRSHQNV